MTKSSIAKFVLGIPVTLVTTIVVFKITDGVETESKAGNASKFLGSLVLAAYISNAIEKRTTDKLVDRFAIWRQTKQSEKKPAKA